MNVFMCFYVFLRSNEVESKFIWVTHTVLSISEKQLVIDILFCSEVCGQIPISSAETAERPDFIVNVFDLEMLGTRRETAVTWSTQEKTFPSTLLEFKELNSGSEKQIHYRGATVRRMISYQNKNKKWLSVLNQFVLVRHTFSVGIYGALRTSHSI